MCSKLDAKVVQAVPQRLHLFPAGLSLVCPGLGQLVQGRPIFLTHVIMWILVIGTSPHFVSMVWVSWTIAHFNAFVAYGGLSLSDFIFILFLIFFSVSPLLLVPFVLFAVLDAATWERGEPSPFKTHFRVLFILLLPLCLFSVLAPAVNAGREAALRMQCTSHMKGLALAFHTYHDVHGSFPPAYTVDANGKPLHSWRVLILPYIEQKELYDKIRLDEPWDSEYNRQFHEALTWEIRMYQCPTKQEMSFTRLLNIFVKNQDIVCRGNCSYSVVIGEGTPFPPDLRKVTFDDITDDTSNTILLVERMTPVNWMDPNNEVRFETAREGISRNLFGTGSEHTLGGANVAFADGSIRFLQETPDGHITTYQKTYESLESLLTKSAGD